MRPTPRTATALLAITACLWLALAGPAAAHHTSLRVPLVPAGSAPPIVLDGSCQFELLATRGGEIRFSLARALDAATGQVVTAAGNRLVVDLLVNGVPRTEVVTFTITGGRVSGPRRGLGLHHPDLVEVRGVSLETSGGAVFGTIGVRGGGPALSSALAQVVGSPSPLELADTRDADVELTGRGGGKLTVRFDRVTPADAPDNTVELEYSLNGGPPAVFTSPAFDVVDEFAKLVAPLQLGLAADDILAIRRLEVFDADGHPFAALGVRIMSP